MEDGKRLKPDSCLGDGVMVEQQTGKEQAEEHNQASNKTRDAVVPAYDADEEAYGCGGEIKED